MSKRDLIALEMKKREEIMNTFDKNYLLEAGAGAGKTTIIVQRIINHVMTGKVNPANIVAITFTKAAATELAERIQLKALEYLKLEKDSKIIERLKAIDRIFTGTIHSFCELILREMPFDANMTPNYEIIEDDFDFHNRVWNSFLRDKQKEYKGKVELLRELGIDYRELRTQAILALENPDIEFAGYGDIDYSYGDLKNEFEKTKEKYSYLSGEPFKNNSNLAKLFRSILQEKKDLKYYQFSLLEEFPKKEESLEETFERLIAKKFHDSDYSKEYMNLIGEVKDVYIKLNKLAYDTCTDFINMVVIYKGERYQGKLTFNELLYRASTLIEKSPDARAHYKNKYRYFYIDEFQDTDPMQADLILNLTDEGDNRPTPGSLFVVGDPKQSIYRFRRADIDIYNKVKEIIGRNGEIVYLDINFRSSDNICNWVESTFKYKDDFGFEEEATHIQAGFKTILSLWDDSIEKEDENPINGIYRYDFPEKDDREYVANMIEDILDNYCIVEKKGKGKEYYNEKRNVRLGDIMILTKANAETGLYLRALKDRGIPALLAGEKQLGDTKEVLNLFILIDALIDYRDDIKVVSALRNAFYMDLDTIDLFMEENKNLFQFIFYKKEIEKIEHQSVKNAFLYLNEIVQLSREFSPIAFIENLIENKVGIYDIHKNYNQLELRDAKSALRQTVEILKSKSCGSIYEIREELKKLVFTAVNYELPISKDEVENAIRIMNIHKAKGLEANIVILAGGEKVRNTFGDSHFVDKEENAIGYMVYKSSHRTLGPDEKERKVREREYKEAEIDRLLYVAATRAKSTLIVAGGQGNNLFLGPLAGNIQREIKSDREVKGSFKDIKLSYEKERELKITRDLRVKKEISSPSYFKITPSSFQSREDEYWEKHNRFSSPNFKAFTIDYWARERQSYKGPRGKIYGIIVHRAMEILINGSKGLKNIDQGVIEYATKTAIDESIDNMEINKTNIGLLYSLEKNKVRDILEIRNEYGNKKAREIIKKNLRNHIRIILNNFIKNEDIIDIFQGAEKIFTELPFTIAINREDEAILQKLSNFISKDHIRAINRNTKSMLINGVIDLVVKSSDGSWTILDYKTDIGFREDIGSKLRKSYGGQLEGYKIIFEEIVKDKGIKIRDLLFYSTFKDSIINLYAQNLMTC